VVGLFDELTTNGIILLCFSDSMTFLFVMINLEDNKLLTDIKNA